MTDPNNPDPKDFEVCLCFHVTLRKLIGHYRNQRPRVPSQMSECFGAGTGCGWCVPFLEKIYEQLEEGKEPRIDVPVKEYGQQRRHYHQRENVAPPDEQTVHAKLEAYLKELPDELKSE